VLRRALGPEVVVTRGPEEIGVDSSRLWCDAAAFQEAIERGGPPEALELYGGDLLTGSYLSDGLPFERWLQATRTKTPSAALKAASASPTFAYHLCPE